MVYVFVLSVVNRILILPALLEGDRKKLAEIVNGTGLTDMVPVRSAPIVPMRFVPLIRAPFRLAPVRFAPERLAFVMSSPVNLAYLNLAKIRFASDKLAPLRAELFKILFV